MVGYGGVGARNCLFGEALTFLPCSVQNSMIFHRLLDENLGCLIGRNSCFMTSDDFSLLFFFLSRMF